MSNQAKRISDFEMTFPASFSDVEERAFGKLYYCREMPDLYDGNHAVISNCNNYDTILNEICCFYNNLRLSPRIYSNWHGGNLYEIKEYLLNHGFSLAVYDDVVIMTLENPNYDFESSLLKIRKVTELDKTIKDIYLKQYKGTTENIYKREILLRNPHVNFFAGYNKDNVCCVYWSNRA